MLVFIVTCLAGSASHALLCKDIHLPKSLSLTLDNTSPDSWEQNWIVRISQYMKETGSGFVGKQAEISYDGNSISAQGIVVGYEYFRISILNLKTHKIEVINQNFQSSNSLSSKVRISVNPNPVLSRGFYFQAEPTNTNSRKLLANFLSDIELAIHQLPESNVVLRLYYDFETSRVLYGKPSIIRNPTNNEAWLVKIKEPDSDNVHIIDPSHFRKISFVIEERKGEFPMDLKSVNENKNPFEKRVLKIYEDKKVEILELSKILMTNKDVFNSQKLYDFLETHSEYAIRLINTWYPKSNWLKLSSSQIPLRHWLITCDPGVASRYDLFTSFYLSNSKLLENLSAFEVRQAFSNYLGVTKVVRSIKVDSEREIPSQLIGNFFENSKVSVEDLSDFFDSWGNQLSLFRGPIQDISHRLKDTSPSLSVSVTPAYNIDLSAAIANTFSRVDKSQVIALTFEVPEITLVRPSSKLLKDYFSDSYYLSYVETQDKKKILLADDSVEMFLFSAVDLQTAIRQFINIESLPILIFPED